LNRASFALNRHLLIDNHSVLPIRDRALGSRPDKV
jgi:hypothetical protein